MLTLVALVQAGSDTDAPARSDGVNDGQEDDLPTLATCGGAFVAGQDPRMPPSPLPSVRVVVPEIRQVQRMEWSAEKEAQRAFTAMAEATDTPIVFAYTPYVVLWQQKDNAMLGVLLCPQFDAAVDDSSFHMPSNASFISHWGVSISQQKP